VLSAAVVLALVGAFVTGQLGHRAPAPVTATAASPATPHGTPTRAIADRSRKHAGQRAARPPHHTATVTGRKKVVAAHGTITVVTAVWVEGASTVAVHVPRDSTVPGMSQLRVERVTGAQMHPFTGTLALRPGNVLHLRSSYRWQGCPARVPRTWPQPLVVPDNVRLHWQRVDAPLHRHRALCG
jgi:hypothetical protein